VRPCVESLLMPELLTDRDAILAFNDGIASFRWGVLFRREQYRAVFGRWLDNLWAGIPDTHLLYSRGGLNQQALNLVRKELEVAGRVRESA
jgi:hypothetical protein